MRPLKNYTSGVPTWRTIARIEEVLAEAGVQGIQKEYDGGRLIALSFSLALPSLKTVKVRLPVDVEAVYKSLASEVRRPRSGQLNRIRDQAERTAWKLQQDWVEVQISLIRLQKVDVLQVFLPYVCVDENRTLYAAIKEGGYKNLLPEHV